MPLAKALARSLALNDLRRAQTNLWWLATEILGYTKLTESFHKPMMDNMDFRRALRQIGKYTKDELELWARDHYKTTVRIAQCVQEILINQDVAIAVAHAVDEKALEFIEEVGTHFQTNTKLRNLRPEIMPGKSAKKWLISDQFTVQRTRFRRHPTMQGKGAGSENTGGHCDIYVLDDIIGQTTIDDNAMPKIRNWYKNTVRNVLKTDGGWIWATGTRWDVNDIYSDWIASDHWDVRIRAALETDGKPDYQGTSVLYGKEWILRKQSELGSSFGPQMMNDPSPSSEKAWDPQLCEHFVNLEYSKGQGFVVVLSDPAPAQIGSFDRRKRGDGEKDYWATAVVKFRQKGQRREIILLDLRSSKGWDHDEGFREVCRLQRKWGARHVAVESVGQAIALYHDTHRRIAREEGVKHFPVKLQNTYLGKKQYFAALVARAKADEFLICSETIPESELDFFLEQVRECRWIEGTTRNTLKFDDHMNVVSFSTDPVFTEYVRTVEDIPEWGPFSQTKEDSLMYKTNYFQW